MKKFTVDETHKVAAPKRALRLLDVSLVVVDGPSRGARVKVEGAIRVGSAESSALPIADPTVSRVHLEIVSGEGAITVRDLGSTNGTFIGGVRVREVDVPPGTVIQIGGSAVRVEAADEPKAVPLSMRTEFGELVGGSIEMRRLYAVLERVAPTDATVLVQGETGTGKDVVARSIHAASKRAAGPFVPIDCGAIPEQLFESELFGHLRGAFTGATNNRRGVFEEASGGTLFLDEIGEMPLSLQPKLLRAIESRTVRPVGASAAVPVDVRIVAATNRSLARAVNSGAFREDLYYRLAVLELDLPPLRARADDIPVLAERFFQSFTHTKDKLDAELAARLAARSWPGNVRELRNYIERAVALGQVSGGGAPPESVRVLPKGIESIVPLHLPLKEARDAWNETFESVYVRAMLKKTGGNVTRAAEAAGVSRRFLQRTVARLGITPSEVGAEALDDEDDA